MARKSAIPMRDNSKLRIDVKSGAAERTLPSGETIMIEKSPSGYEVSVWRENGYNRWVKHFAIFEEAVDEFRRW